MYARAEKLERRRRCKLGGLGYAPLENFCHVTLLKYGIISVAEVQTFLLMKCP